MESSLKTSKQKQLKQKKAKKDRGARKRKKTSRVFEEKKCDKCAIAGKISRKFLSRGAEKKPTNRCFARKTNAKAKEFYTHISWLAFWCTCLQRPLLNLTAFIVTHLARVMFSSHLLGSPALASSLPFSSSFVGSRFSISLAI